MDNMSKQVENTITQYITLLNPLTDLKSFKYFGNKYKLQSIFFPKEKLQLFSSDHKCYLLASAHSSFSKEWLYTCIWLDDLTDYCKHATIRKLI